MMQFGAGRACGLAVMTSLSHSEGRRFKSGQAHLEMGDIDNNKKVSLFINLIIFKSLNIYKNVLYLSNVNINPIGPVDLL